MWLAEHESEWDNEELITEVVADVQDPGPPIFQAAYHRERPYDARRVVTRLRQVVNSDAAAISQDFLRARAVEVDLGHVHLPTRHKQRIDETRPLAIAAKLAFREKLVLVAIVASVNSAHANVA
jgi:hypothetical protein